MCSFLQVQAFRQIQSANVGAHSALERLMPRGVAFHHAGVFGGAEGAVLQGVCCV
jgi:replicative superfamily II helicase